MRLQNKDATYAVSYDEPKHLGELYHVSVLVIRNGDATALTDESEMDYRVQRFIDYIWYTYDMYNTVIDVMWSESTDLLQMCDKQPKDMTDEELIAWNKLPVEQVLDMIGRERILFNPVWNVGFVWNVHKINE